MSNEDLYEESASVGISDHSRAERQRVRGQVAVAFRVNEDAVTEIAGTSEFVVDPLVKPG